MDEKRKEELKKLITGRQKKLESLKSPMIDVWQSVSEYVNIGLGDMSNNGADISQSISSLGRKAFNGTAIGAAVLATDGIHGYHVSPAFPWFSYMMSRNELNKVPQIKEWLQAEQEEVYSVLNNSNFYAEMWPFVYNGFTVGTTVLYGEWNWEEQKVRLECIHPREIYIDENNFSTVDILHRKYKRNARQLVQKFGKNKVSQSVKDAYKNSPFDEFEIIHAVFPREEYDDRKKTATNKKYASIWYETGSGNVIDESGYDVFPYKVWRYSRFSNYVYGLSPAILYMCDIKGLNIISKTLLGAAQMAVDPPLNVPADLVGKVQWRPRGINPYDKEGIVVRPALETGKYPIGTDREERMELSIKERFHTDTFVLMGQLAGQGQRTAYEVSEMMGEKAVILGAELAPLNVQMDAILDLIYSLKANAVQGNGTITPPPDILYDLAVEGDAFSPVYLGPLAQAQRRLYKTQGLQGALEVATPVIKMFPESARVIKPEETLRVILDSFNFPQSAMATKEEVAAAKEQEANAAAELQQKEELMQMAGGAKTLSEVDRNTGNMVTQAIAGQMGGMNGIAA